MFALPATVFEAVPFQSTCQLTRGNAFQNIRVPHLDTGDPLMQRSAVQVSFERLDFGQLWHRAYVNCSTYLFSGTALLWSAFLARCHRSSSGYARGVLTGFGDLLHYFGCLLRRRSVGDVSLRNNATATSALINNWHAADLVFFHNPAALLDACLGCDRHRRARHGIAHPCLLRALPSSRLLAAHYAPAYSKRDWRS